jgi:cyanophycinase
MIKSNLITLLLVFITISVQAFGQDGNGNVTKGPPKGTLVIVGGGAADSVIADFIKIAGGKDVPIVVIPTAEGSNSYNQNSGGASTFRKLGATNVRVIHTYARDVANSDTFNLPLKAAAAVWFGGGRQWRLADAYKGTLTEKMIRELLGRGGVVGGSSAGATIQGSFLVRGDTKNNQIMMGDHQEGMGFLKNAAIDQHVLARNRQFDMFEVMKEHPELLGISIDEGTAIVVREGEFEVIGRSYVIVYDGTFWSREGSELKKLPGKDQLFYFLRKGDKYDMVQRKVMQSN